MTLAGIWELKKLALRNLARHKVKTILSSAAIMVSVALFIVLNGWLSGMIIESRRNIVNYEIGAAKLQTRLYFERKDEMPSYENFKDWEIYRDALYGEGYVSAPRFVFSGILFSSSGSAPVLFHGIDPTAEKQVLRYPQYVDFGRFVQSSNFEIVLGIVAAEKLKVGIPVRPLRLELEEVIAAVSRNSAEGDFIRSLYYAAPSGAGGMLAVEERVAEGNERMILRRNASRADLDRYWEIIAASNRNDVRINAVIDIKAAPGMIRRNRWENELWPALRLEDQAVVAAAYMYEEFAGAYYLAEQDEQKLSRVLDAMIRAEYSGAIRHVHQLLDVVVVGVINSPAPLPNGNTAYIPLDVLQGETGMMLDSAITELVIRERNVPDSRLPGKSESSAVITAALAAQGRPLPEELAVFVWQDYMRDYLGFEAMENMVPQFIASLLFLLSFLVISNTILLAILERTREIGMMRALGMTDRQMIMVYMLEACFLGFIGAALGVIIGCIINYPMVKYGMDFSAMADTMGSGIGFRITSNLRSMWNVPVIIGTFAAATLLSSLMAFFPTRRAVKMPITSSLRFD